MRIRWRLLLKLLGLGIILIMAAGLIAPFLTADQFGKRLQASLEGALGRRVKFGKVHYNLFTGPGFSVSDVTIYEDPAIGAEPIAYIQDPGSLQVVPSLWALLRGHFEIASIRLDGASLNLSKSGPASEWGRWNFAALVNRSVMRTIPAIHVRNGRINFKFGDTKSVFYLMNTDLDIAPPGSLGGGWTVSCEAQAARTDRPALGLGGFTLGGKWYVAPERVDLNLQLDRAALGDLTALLRGQAGGIHGTISSRLHLAGPIDGIGILGRLTIEDVHRWDLLPPKGAGWPLDIRGRLNLTSQQLELQSTSSVVPVTVHFRASDYLARPHWAVTVNWNRFPAAPVLELARHMGAQLPPKLQLGGTIDGAIGYSGEGSFQGQLALHDTAVTIPDSPPVRFDQAYLLVDHGHVRLSPAVVHTSDQDEARIEGDYAMDENTLNLAISTDSMKVESLRAQVALAAVPWLEQVSTGEWQGQLRYHRTAENAEWNGALAIAGARISVPGLADPLEIASARVRIDGPRVVLDRLDAQAGKIALAGEYRYDPEAVRPHRLRLHAVQLDAADLEDELAPVLRHSPGLIARALGRSAVPDYLRQLKLEGSLQIDTLQLGSARLDNLRARLLWDVTRVDLTAIQAHMEHASVAGALEVNLRGRSPAYTFTGKLSGLGWQSGTLDAEGTLETSGTASQLLANLKSDGTFNGTGLDFGTLAPWRSASGTYALSWIQASPRIRLSDLRLRTEDETYTGRGATQEDGRLLIVLTNGAREMRMTGTLASVRVDDTPRP
ncbi:MAG TPA: hypothetical protein VGF16_19040 [Bryobacteraceae bacterium]